MYPQVVKYRLWQMALRMDAQSAVYKVRQAASSVGTADSFESYQLLRVVYQPPTVAELNFAQATLADQYGKWTILTPDLDQAQAPVPQVTYELVIGSNTWIIERINNTCLMQAFECLCRLAR